MSRLGELNSELKDNVRPKKRLILSSDWLRKSKTDDEFSLSLSSRKLMLSTCQPVPIYNFALTIHTNRSLSHSSYVINNTFHVIKKNNTFHVIIYLKRTNFPGVTFNLFFHSEKTKEQETVAIYIEQKDESLIQIIRIISLITFSFYFIIISIFYGILILRFASLFYPLTPF